MTAAVTAPGWRASAGAGAASAGARTPRPAGDPAVIRSVGGSAVATDPSQPAARGGAGADDPAARRLGHRPPPRRRPARRGARRQRAAGGAAGLRDLGSLRGLPPGAVPLVAPRLPPHDDPVREPRVG